MLFAPFSTKSNEGPQMIVNAHGNENKSGIRSTSPQDIATVPSSKPLASWTKEEVQAWFSSSDDFKEFASRFSLSGKSLAGLSKEDFVLITKDTAQGIALYNAVQALKGEKEKPKETIETVIQRALKGVGTMVASNEDIALDIPLLERSEQLEKIVEIVQNNLHTMVGRQSQQQREGGSVTEKAKTDLVIPTITGGSGIGKTRLGSEAARELFKPEQWKRIAPEQFQNAHTLYLYMDFANGYILGDRDENLSPSRILAIRMAHAYFVMKKRLNLDFGTFFALCSSHIDLFNMDDVLLLIRADLNLIMDVPLFVFLHIDEVQYIFNFQEHYKYSSKGIFRDLINTAGRFFSSGVLTIQPVISGTAHRKVMEENEASMYTFTYIDTPLLSLEATIRLIEHYAAQFGAHPWEWKMNLPFLQLLGDMGGLPRAISYLLKECFGKDYSKGPEFFQQISSLSFYPIFTSVVNSVSEKYGLKGFISKNKAAGRKVLSYALQGASIARDDVLGNVSVEEMEYKGHIFLQQVGQNYYFRVPFLFVFIYNQELRIIPQGLSDIAFNHDQKVTWQDWESFNAIFQVFRNNLFYDQKEIKKTLGDFYHRADGHINTKKLVITLNRLELVSLLHRFPSKNQPVVSKDTGEEINWTTGNYLLLNGKSAEFGDTVLPRVVEERSAQRYFGREVHILIISGQQKWDYNGEDFTIEQAMEEHKKALETAKSAGIPDSCGLITVIFTTQRLPKDKIQSIPKDILIIHQGNFKDYYGPFADRANFSVAHDLNPNFADIQHLQALEGVGEETAKEIVQERQKRPFENFDDLCTRVPRIKKDKLTRELTFFPFEGYTKQKA